MSISIKKLGLFAALFAVVTLMGVSFASCSDENTETDNYFVECTKVECDDFTAQDLNEIKADMNTELVGETWTDLTKDQAKTKFDAVMQSVVLSYDPAVWNFLESPLDMTFALKNMAGKEIKTQKVRFTADKAELK